MPYPDSSRTPKRDVLYPLLRHNEASIQMYSDFAVSATRLDSSCSRTSNKCNNYMGDFALYPIVLEREISGRGVVQL